MKHIYYKGLRQNIRNFLASWFNVPLDFHVDNEVPY